jgi:hypothetical protein
LIESRRYVRDLHGNSDFPVKKGGLEEVTHLLRGPYTCWFAALTSINLLEIHFLRFHPRSTALESLGTVPRDYILRDLPRIQKLETHYPATEV